MASRLLIIFQPRESVSQQHLLSYWFPSGPTGLNEMRCTDVQLFASPSPHFAHSALNLQAKQMEAVTLTTIRADSAHITTKELKFAQPNLQQNILLLLGWKTSGIPVLHYDSPLL
jgi:hypothetical protein